MPSLQEIAEKEAALQKEQECAGNTVQAQTLGGYACGEMGTNKPKSWMGRIRDRLEFAARESSKLSKLQELQYLLDKNPEVARILELLEEIQ